MKKILLIFFLSFNLYPSKYISNGKITENFDVPKGLERAVDFWIDIFAKYDSNDLIIYDSENYIIYEVLNISDINNLKTHSDKVKKEFVDSLVTRIFKKYTEALKSLDLNKDKLIASDSFSLSLYNKFKFLDEESKFKDALKPGSMKAQRGHKDNFRKALYYSAKYLPFMEDIFKDKNIPWELTRLPFVESFFNPNAVSKRRASGIWQFMPYTGREYLRVEKHYDERNDPILSTYAAADELLKNYKYLNCWTLAVTAYNHGRYGIKRALNSSNSTTLMELIKNHKGKNFGFDTKNFYAEFLAALYIEKNPYKFFDDLIYADKHSVKTIVLKHSMNIEKLEELLDIDKQNIKYYNPALSNPIINGTQKVPEGAKINIPISNFEKFTSKLERENIKDYVRVI